MKIPKIDKNPKKSGIIYPEVTTWDVVKEYWKLTPGLRGTGCYVFVGAVIATVSQSVIAPLYYKKFFDLISSPPAGGVSLVPELTSTVLFILGLNLLAWISFRSALFIISYFEGYVMARCKEYTFDYVLGHSHSFFSNTFAGALVQKVNRFSRSFERIFDRLALDVVPLILKITGAVIVLYVFQPLIAYGILIWVAVFVVTSYFFTRFKLKYDQKAAELDSKVNAGMSDSISNHNAIQLFTASFQESKSFGKINNQWRDINLFRWNLQISIESLQTLLALTIEFFVFYFGIKYWSMGLMSVGTFVLVQTYIIVIGSSLWNFGRILRDLYEGIADAKEMVEILHLKHEIQDVPDAQKLLVNKGAIEFKNVGFTFAKPGEEGKTVFDDMNISIKPGEKVAFIGSSGAGKSTLIKLLLRLHDIQKGEILVDGQNIKEVTQNSLRENISLVPQDPALFHRTLMENIRYGKRGATDAEVIEAAKLAHCDIFINEFPQKYETYVGERGVKLSGGERQRVAIARALLKNAPILVLDEATSSLDSHSESLIQDALHTLMKGKTTIVIAHRLSTIRQMDRIIVVSKGGVIEEGSHDELLRKSGGIYAKLWSLQAGGFSGESIEDLLEV